MSHRSVLCTHILPCTSSHHKLVRPETLGAQLCPLPQPHLLVTAEPRNLPFPRPESPFPSPSLNPPSGSVQGMLPATYPRQQGLFQGPALQEALLPTPSLSGQPQSKGLQKENKP